jgi:hypothetical protein
MMTFVYNPGKKAIQRLITYIVPQQITAHKTATKIRTSSVLAEKI